MVKKTFKVVVDPNIVVEECNPVCYDKTIHIRFANYDSSKTIAGIEDKLTYLLTYLFNKEFAYYYVDRDDIAANTTDFKKLWEKYIKRFKESDSFKAVLNVVQTKYKVKDILLAPMYLKNGYKNAWKQFGHLDDGAYISVRSENYLNGSGSLQLFTDTFKLSLKDLLLNDSVYFRVSEYTPKDVNKKFLNKERTKDAKKKKNLDKYVANSLWW